MHTNAHTQWGHRQAGRERERERENTRAIEETVYVNISKSQHNNLATIIAIGTETVHLQPQMKEKLNFYNMSFCTL